VQKNVHKRNERSSDLKKKWGPVVDCIADLLGPRAEVVLHDVRHPDCSIVLIRNGEVTGRSVGAPLTDVGFFMLRESDKRIDTLGIYRSRTEAGKDLKCNAANLRDERGNIEAMLCINLDITNDAAVNQRNGDIDLSEYYGGDIQRVIDRIVADVSARANNSDSLRSREEMLELISSLDARGVFLARGAVRQISSALNIAVPTMYKYLKESKGFRKKSVSTTVTKETRS
jgi:predicted transcriptional regulator YheO